MGHCEEEQSPSLTCLMTSYTRSAETGLAKSPSTCSETEGKERKGDQPAGAKATATPQKVEEGNSGRERGRESPVGGGQLASLPIAERTLSTCQPAAGGKKSGRLEITRD